MKKSKKKFLISLELPADVLALYREAARLTGITVGQAVLLVVTLDALKITQQARREGEVK